MEYGNYMENIIGNIKKYGDSLIHRAIPFDCKSVINHFSLTFVKLERTTIPCFVVF
jgi:hypothetical protein